MGAAFKLLMVGASLKNKGLLDGVTIIQIWQNKKNSSKISVCFAEIFFAIGNRQTK